MRTSDAVFLRARQDFGHETAFLVMPRRLIMPRLAHVSGAAEAPALSRAQPGKEVFRLFGGERVEETFGHEGGGEGGEGSEVLARDFSLGAGGVFDGDVGGRVLGDEAGEDLAFFGDKRV